MTQEGPDFAAPLALAQRAVTAFLALSLRCSGLILAARAFPPIFPPLRPRATAAGFFRLATIPLYVSGHEKSTSDYH